jgi:hypothetical protein
MSKSNWSEKARDGLNATKEFLKEYGSGTGMTGAALFGAMGAVCAVSGMSAPQPEIAEMFKDASAALIVSGVLIGSGLHAAEVIIKNQLRNGDDIAAKVKGALPAHRPQATIEAFDPSKGPYFQDAMRDLYERMNDSPEFRADIVQLLKNNPSARKAFVEEFSERQEAAGLNALNTAKAAPVYDNQDYDTSPGMSN